MFEPSKNPLKVSDHAVLRYLERVYEFKMELIREHILGICAAPAAFGATAVRTEGIKFIIENGVVVTTAPDTNTLSNTTRARAQEKIVRGK